MGIARHVIVSIQTNRYSEEGALWKVLRKQTCLNSAVALFM